MWKDIITPESKWAFPNISSYKNQLQKVYKNYGMYKKWAISLKEEISKNHKIEDILNKYNISIFGSPAANNNATIQELKEKALNIKDVKNRASFAKGVVNGSFSQLEKIEFLKVLFKGETAYVLSCGPTLTEHDSKKISSLLKNNLCFAIKQSFDLFQDLVDIHIYNCANFKKYDYTNNRPIVIEATTTPYRLGDCDLKFFIKERDFNNSVSATEDFESWTFDNQPLLRPYGPGIMYEVVFYALQHLGLSEIITIGWDNKLISGTAAQQHFYDKEGSSLKKSDFIHSNEVAQNPSAVQSLEREGKVSTNAILPWYNWLKSKGAELKIISDINPAPEEIKRVQI